MAGHRSEQYVFDLKLRAKELSKESNRLLKREAEEKVKCKQSIQKNQPEKARIHAENSIRHHNQSMNMLRMSARIDGIALQIQSAVNTRKVTASIAGVCKSMELALKTMNLEKISKLLEKFESEFETMDIHTSVVDKTMNDSTTTSVPINNVNTLMQSIAEEAGLDLKLEFPTKAVSEPGTSSAIPNDDDDLSARLAKLRNS